MTADALAGVAAAAQGARAKGPPPVHLWNPTHCGEIDIVIKRDGVWMHEGTPIGREALVRLFASVLRLDLDGYHLVTPVEKLKITVEDAPFRAVRVDREGDVLRFLTDVGDEVEAGPDHALRVETDPDTQEPAPYLHVRRGLEARLTRPVFYELVEMAEPMRVDGVERMAVASNGAVFPLDPPPRVRVTAASAPADLERLFAERLHRLDAPQRATGRSDFDLNPDAWRADRTLADAAVLVPLVERPGGLSVILTRRSDALTKHSGQIALPGGRLDPGETPVQAALREAQEEVGLDPAFVRPLGLADDYETITGYRVTPVVAFVSPGFTLVPAEAEVAEVFEAPFAWLMDAANHELRTGRDPRGVERRYYVMPWEGRQIWGATAGMLRGLYERVFEGDGAQPT